MAEELTLEDVQNLIEEPDFDIKALRELMKNELGHELTDGVEEDPEALAKEVFEAYRNKAAEVKEERSASKKKTREKKKTATSSSTSSVSRAAYIEGLIKEQGSITKAELENSVDEAFGYAEAGKSSRTRVNRTVRNLKEKGLVTDEGGKITWVK